MKDLRRCTRLLEDSEKAPPKPGPTLLGLGLASVSLSQKTLRFSMVQRQNMHKAQPTVVFL